jgi:hypothetical protein
MGCLIFNIENRTIQDVVASAENLNSDLTTLVVCENTVILFNAKAKNHGIQANAGNKNVEINLGKTNHNVQISINAGLVCGTGLNMYEILYVSEGPLMVEEGYLRVKKVRT